MSNTKLFAILGNQLFNPKLYLNKFQDVDFFMCEDFGLCSYVKHHKLKILHVLASMRSYKDELQELGFNLTYYGIEEKKFYEPYTSKLKELVLKKKYKKVFFFEIEDKFFENQIKRIKDIAEIEFIKSPMFLYSRNEFSDFFSGKRKPLMASFYKYSRRKNNILMNEDKPVGNKWSFDEDNRKKLPKDINIPNTTLFKGNRESLSSF